MLSKLPGKPLDIVLNLVFGVWMAYFVATGCVIPSPLLRQHAKASTAEVLPVEAPLAPLELPLEES